MPLSEEKAVSQQMVLRPQDLGLSNGFLHVTLKAQQKEK